MKPPPGVPWDAGGGATYESGEALTPPHIETDFRDAQAIDFAGGIFRPVCYPLRDGEGGSEFIDHGKDDLARDAVLASAPSFIF